MTDVSWAQALHESDLRRRIPIVQKHLEWLLSKRFTMTNEH